MASKFTGKPLVDIHQHILVQPLLKSCPSLLVHVGSEGVAPWPGPWAGMTPGIPAELSRKSQRCSINIVLTK